MSLLGRTPSHGECDLPKKAAFVGVRWRSLLATNGCPPTTASSRRSFLDRSHHTVQKGHLTVSPKQRLQPSFGFGLCHPLRKLSKIKTISPYTRVSSACTNHPRTRKERDTGTNTLTQPTQPPRQKHAKTLTTRNARYRPTLSKPQKDMHTCIHAHTNHTKKKRAPQPPTNPGNKVKWGKNVTFLRSFPLSGKKKSSCS